MKKTVEIRLHGSRDDVLTAAEMLTAQGAVFRERIYEDRGASKQVRLYGEMPAACCVDPELRKGGDRA